MAAFDRDALGPAAQNHGITAFHAQRGGVGRHVGTALVDDADHAERHAHARDLEAVRPFPFGDNLTDGILARRDGLDTGGSAFEPFIVEREPVDHRARKAVTLRGRDILRVGRENVRFGAAQLSGGRLERPALHGRRHAGERLGRRARSASETDHLLVEVLLKLTFRDAHGGYLVSISTKSSRWMISSRPR